MNDGKRPGNETPTHPSASSEYSRFHGWCWSMHFSRRVDCGGTALGQKIGSGGERDTG